MRHMKRTGVHIWTAILVLAVAWSETSASDQGSTVNLARRLRGLFESKQCTYQRPLRDATHLARDASLDHPWTDVKSALDQQGLREMQSHDDECSSRYRFLVSPDVWAAYDETAHSLFLEFIVDRRKKEDFADAKPGRVTKVVAGLRATPNRPYAAVVARRPYPCGSVLARGIRLANASAAAKKYPVLKEIEVSYDFLHNRWLDTVPQGFELRLTFGASRRDDRRGKSLFFPVESRLDALQDWDGNALQKGYISKDSLGKFEGWGSTEWRQDE